MVNKSSKSTPTPTLAPAPAPAEPPGLTTSSGPISSTGSQSLAGGRKRRRKTRKVKKSRKHRKYRGGKKSKKKPRPVFVDAYCRRGRKRTRSRK